MCYLVNKDPHRPKAAKALFLRLSSRESLPRDGRENLWRPRRSTVAAQIHNHLRLEGLRRLYLIGNDGVNFLKEGQVSSVVAVSGGRPSQNAADKSDRLRRMSGKRPSWLVPTTAVGRTFIETAELVRSFVGRHPPASRGSTCWFISSCLIGGESSVRFRRSKEKRGR